MESSECDCGVYDPSFVARVKSESFENGRSILDHIRRNIMAKKTDPFQLVDPAKQAMLQQTRQAVDTYSIFGRK